MRSISLFPRQVIHARIGNRGQAVTLLLVTVVLLLSLIFSAVYLSHQGLIKITSADKVDSIAISAATWEARGLNLIAALNEGVYQCIRLIRWICAIWVVLAIASATGYGAAIFAAYTDYAQDIIRNLWNRATELSEWAERVKQMTPSLVLVETASLSMKLKVTGILTPINVGGAHDAENTLELHLKKGKAIGISEALSPIIDLLGSDIGGAVKSILNPIIAGFLGASQKPIRLLIPEDDFEEKQFVRYAGYRDPEDLSLPFLGAVGRRRYLFSSFAQPYGGSDREMSWKSRLFKKETAQ